MRLVTLFIVLLPASALAQGPASQDTQVPGGALMLASYLVLWALMLGYLAYLARKQAALEDDLEGLRKRLDDLLGLGD